jgi:hypothetical protein
LSTKSSELLDGTCKCKRSICSETLPSLIKYFPFHSRQFHVWDEWSDVARLHVHLDVRPPHAHVTPCSYPLASTIGRRFHIQHGCHLTWSHFQFVLWNLCPRRLENNRRPHVHKSIYKFFFTTKTLQVQQRKATYAMSAVGNSVKSASIRAFIRSRSRRVSFPAL